MGVTIIEKTQIYLRRHLPHALKGSENSTRWVKNVGVKRRHLPHSALIDTLGLGLECYVKYATGSSYGWEQDFATGGGVLGNRCRICLFGSPLLEIKLEVSRKAGFFIQWGRVVGGASLATWRTLKNSTMNAAFAKKCINHTCPMELFLLLFVWQIWWIFFTHPSGKRQRLCRKVVHKLWVCLCLCACVRKALLPPSS